MLTDKLPKLILEMTDVIGLTNTLAIVALTGGTRLAVPSRPKEEHWLVEIIGMESFQKLCHYYQGEELSIPRCHDAINLVMKKEILADSENLTVKGLACKYNYTERGIRMLLTRLKSQADA